MLMFALARANEALDCGLETCDAFVNALILNAGEGAQRLNLKTCHRTAKAMDI